MSRRVYVKNFLANAKRNSKTECPIALALKDAYDAGEVIVEGSTITVVGKDGVTLSEGDVGEDLSECIKHYDETGEWTGLDHFFVISPLEYMTAASMPTTGTYHRE
jgi:hypothetical protein